MDVCRKTTTKDLHGLPMVLTGYIYNLKNKKFFSKSRKNTVSKIFSDSLHIKDHDFFSAINFCYREQYFKPGTSYTQVVGASQIGRIRSAFLYWRHDTTFNILTWRIVHPTVYLSNITIDSLEEDSRYFCHI